MKKNSDVSGIVLLAKQSGLTSFSSLYTVKKALGTSKVGHTGTLDSFAQGLLVVCVGNITRLASHITSFDKSYEAVIEFGKETDTLDPTGDVIKTTRLPLLSELTAALKKFTGNIEQVPPAFSALRVDGERSSDLMRKGQSVELKARPITVYKSEILEVKTADAGGVQYARIRFDVSKGTYIRCLARDIAAECNSAGYLAGLIRTKIGLFDLQDAAGYELLDSFTIDSVLKNLNHDVPKENFDFIVEQVKNKISNVTPEVAKLCGLPPVFLNEENKSDFYNGRFLKPKMFSSFSFGECAEGKYSVFLRDMTFAGVISFDGKRLSYEYVIPLK